MGCVGWLHPTRSSRCPVRIFDRLPIGEPDGLCRWQYTRIVSSWNFDDAVYRWRYSLPILMEGLRRGAWYRSDVPAGLRPSRFTGAQVALILTRWVHQQVLTRATLAYAFCGAGVKDEIDRAALRTWAEEVWVDCLAIHNAG